ncbi:early morphogenesis virion phosphoprotein [Pteropox virus]|uniref:Assembly protein G7 n=1 Tax=Pteropox virus TaxID=1873698 RepID=A0A1B1MRB0_9POXV|nr:early morphogenesis virion phosphoprotein [Pteropox virus]ANS71146.1 early morphogenesis virion phosphoprotein [Pteropox virus]
MIDEQRASCLYSTISSSIVRSVTKGIIKNPNSLEKLARSVYNCDAAKRDQLLSALYAKIEADISVSDTLTLLTILKRLKPHSAYVYNLNEFDRLYCSLMRFTHCNSFFNVFQHTVNSTLSVLITLILSNQLFYAADIVESVENYLFNTQKPLSVELFELLQMKYALINLVQYKMFPVILGKPVQVIGGSPIHDNVAESTQIEVEKMIDMPIKCDAINDMYKFLAEKGIAASINQAEFMAGLKIQEVQDLATTVETALQTQPVQQIARRPSPQLSIQQNQAQLYNQQQQILNTAKDFNDGKILNGRVTSPLGNAENTSEFIKLSDSELTKYSILEYLYAIRVLANAIKTRSLACASKGITVNINSPFKSLTVPQKISDTLSKVPAKSVQTCAITNQRQQQFIRP